MSIIAVLVQDDIVPGLEIVHAQLPDGKVRCVQCRHMIFRQAAHRTNEGWACKGCSDES